MIPTRLMTGIKKKLLVPFRAGDGALHNAGFESEISHSRLHPRAHFVVLLGRAHDTALADPALSNFELGLDEYNHAAFRAQNGGDCRQNECYGDEADVNGGQGGILADIFESQVPRVDALVNRDTGIVAEPPIE